MLKGGFIYNGGVELKVEVKMIIDDAEVLVKKAVEEMDVNIRDAAEKAWGAAVRATDALILDRCGVAPKSMRDRRERLGELILREPKLDRLGLWERLYSRESSLHVSCFYDGECRPVEMIKRKIVETINYVEDVKRAIAPP